VSWEILLATIIGAIIGALAASIVPRVLTAKARGQKASRHVRAEWEDFALFVERQVRDVRKQLGQEQEELITRGVFHSSEAQARRNSIYVSHCDALGDEWRRVQREASDLQADLGRVARRWFHVDPVFQASAGEESIFEDARMRLEAALNEVWPDRGR